MFPLIGFYQAKRTTRTLDINTVWSPRSIHIRGNSIKSKTGCIFQFFFRGRSSYTSNHFLLLGTMKLSNNSLIEKQVTVTFFCGISPALEMCACVCTCAPVRLSPAVVMVAALSQHAVGAVRERGEEASRGRRLQARGAVGARGVSCRTGLWKRHHTGAASTGSGDTLQ